MHSTFSLYSSTCNTNAYFSRCLGCPFDNTELNSLHLGCCNGRDDFLWNARSLNLEGQVSKTNTAVLAAA